MNDFVELQRLISVVLRRWYLLLVLMALGAGAGYAISLRQTPAYQATTTVLVGQIAQASSITREDVQLSELFAQTYADLAVRQPVMQGVVEALQLKRPEDVQVLAVVKIPDDLSKMTVNLRAPIVINTVNNRAVQIVLEDERYSLRHPVVGAMKDAG